MVELRFLFNKSSAQSTGNGSQSGSVVLCVLLASLFV